MEKLRFREIPYLKPHKEVAQIISLLFCRVSGLNFCIIGKINIQNNCPKDNFGCI